MASVKKVWVYISLSCCFLLPDISSAEPLTLPGAELHINMFFAHAGSLRNDLEKKQLADSISQLIRQTLSMPGSFDYPFDRISQMGKIKSPDEKIRIYTWNLPWSDGTNTYYGFLQYKTETKNEVRLMELMDRSTDTSDAQESTLTPENWYGMLIYEIIEKKYNNRTWYTLLGYDNENPFLSRKIVDELYFNNGNEPLFGKAIFHYHGRLLCRILFEYSAKTQMSLKWNDKLKMIVFDHLSPSKSTFTGNYQYYGPDFSYDGLRFENGIWEEVEDVDVRNMHE